MERDGWQVVVVGNFNVAPDERDGYPRLRTFRRQHVINRADFLSKMFSKYNGWICEYSRESRKEKWAGVDICRELHTEKRGYTYYPRTKEWESSCDKFDYVIVGRKPWKREMAMSSKILEIGERDPSDHCPVWVDINIGKDKKHIEK
ncbi:hypothetical protein CC78DRAFT_360892 [Lojkania enalia]|uniref:Uncharacterized protein n=1 Tax=Lojkania enalia TaxID=147567 RepID=A0A9P4K240_9PLEO|nr:hypothetical protein CC78DRAFT_360892 [Didymosphaeria enalia]